MPHSLAARHTWPGVFLSMRVLFVPTFSSTPVLEGFNFTGGMALTPEFAALLAGLALYTAAFIAEIVRAGGLAIQRGQCDAPYALGLSRRQARPRVVAPHALPVIGPPF